MRDKLSASSLWTWVLLSIRLRDVPFNRTIGISQPLPIEELPPDYYELRLALFDGREETLAEAGSQFIVSPLEALSRPVTLFKSFPLANAFFYYHVLAEQFDYYLLKGMALEEKGPYGAAIENLLEGNKIDNSDTRLLNSLGRCYYRTGQKKEALAALRASLRLNTAQKDVQDLAAGIERELK